MDKYFIKLTSKPPNNPFSDRFPTITFGVKHSVRHVCLEKDSWDIGLRVRRRCGWRRTAVQVNRRTVTSGDYLILHINDALINISPLTMDILRRVWYWWSNSPLCRLPQLFFRLIGEQRPQRRVGWELNIFLLFFFSMLRSWMLPVRPLTAQGKDVFHEFSHHIQSSYWPRFSVSGNCGDHSSKVIRTNHFYDNNRNPLNTITRTQRERIVCLLWNRRIKATR